MSSKIHAKIIILCSLFLSFLLIAQDKFSIDETIENCRNIDDSSKRLQCYDKITTENPVQLTYSNTPTTPQNIPAIIADLEEPRMFLSYGRMNFLNNDINAALLGVGTRTKLKTIQIPKINKSIDFNIIGLIKSQFDVSEIDTRNNRGGALINTDFMIGGELVRNFHNGNLRLKYTHQSFHLGDEFLIDNPYYLDNRLNLSYETIEVTAFKNINNWNTYIGSSFIVRSEPGNIDKFKLHTGIQYHGHKREWFTPLFGIDFKAWGETNWKINTSFKAGVEFSGFLDQPLQFMFEYYNGKSPYGQFINENLKFIGLSVNHYW